MLTKNARLPQDKGYGVNGPYEAPRHTVNTVTIG